MEGTVTAATEGDAGEMVDKELMKLLIIDYKIDTIDEIEKIVKENNVDTLSGDDEEIQYINKLLIVMKENQKNLLHHIIKLC